MKAYPKKTKAAYQPRFTAEGSINPELVVFTSARQRSQLAVTANTPASWMNADGTKNFDKYNDFLAERELASRNSKSF